MRRIVSVILVAALTVTAFTGCGKGEGKKSVRKSYSLNSKFDIDAYLTNLRNDLTPIAEVRKEADRYDITKAVYNKVRFDKDSVIESFPDADEVSIIRTDKACEIESYKSGLKKVLGLKTTLDILEKGLGTNVSFVVSDISFVYAPLQTNDDKTTIGIPGWMFYGKNKTDGNLMRIFVDGLTGQIYTFILHS